MNYYEKLIEQIIQDFNSIKFVFVQDGDAYCQNNGLEYYVDSCFYIPFSREIQVGIYSDLELKVIGILHQIGHDQSNNDDNCCIYSQQLQAWKKAYTLAKQYGLQLSHKIFEYTLDCLDTYNKPQYF